MELIVMAQTAQYQCRKCGKTFPLQWELSESERLCRLMMGGTRLLGSRHRRQTQYGTRKCDS
jgi:hypothetical protein